MTTVTAPLAEAASDQPHDVAPGRRPGHRLWGWLLPLLLVVLAVGLRWFRLATSYDLFIDEPFYLTLGQSVADGGLPFAAGSYFFLHPPGYSVLAALWIQLTGGSSGTIIEQVFQLRHLNVLFAGVSTALLYLIGRRVSGVAVGLIAAIAFAISPWLIKQNSFVMLETSSLTFVLAGFLILLSLPDSRRGRPWALVAVGLSFGYGVLIKEFAVFVTILPILVICLRRARPAGRHGLERAVGPRQPLISRAEGALVIAATCVPYVIWVLVVLLSGNIGEFWAQTMAGFNRAAGVHQISGFNQAGTPSFLATLASNAPQFWTTYLQMGLGALACLHLLRQRSEHGRVIGAFTFGSIPLLAYSVTLGANEEQFYYFLLIPSALAVAFCARELWEQRRPWLRRTLVVLAVACIASNLATWTLVHTRFDNDAYQVDTWMRAHVPDGSTVVVTDGVQREIFLRYDMVNADSPADVAEIDGRHYVVAFRREVEKGYAFLSPEQLTDLVGGRGPIYTTTGPGNSVIDVYQIG